MGGLGQYLEEEGLATTQVSLIRVHTEKIRPPRALWVPFDLGRPLGEPNDPAFQRRVVIAALRLLEAESGPVLEDYPDDAPSMTDVPGWGPPVELPPAPDTEDPATLRAAVEAELDHLRPFYEQSVTRQGRTTAGTSKLSLDELVPFVLGFLSDSPPDNPRQDLPHAETLRLASEDLKTCWLEAVTQPDRIGSPNQLIHWFWERTAAGKAFLTLGAHFREADDQSYKALGGFILTPPY